MSNPAIHLRRGDAYPVLLSVPHSGRDYDKALVSAARVGKIALQRLEDPLVDKLVAPAIGQGIGAVIVNVPRAAIDCNRAEDELDPRSVAGRPGPAPTPRSRAGLGLIPTRITGLGELWRAPISEAELQRRLDTVHRPYHAALDDALARLARRWGEVLLLDCHSMPPRPRGEANVIIGDRHGTTAAPWLSEEAARIADRLGFAVARNHPFAGGHIVACHGRPEAGVHALQIEVDRSCYLARDLATVGPGFGRVERLFEALATQLGGQLAAQLREAAE